MHGGRAALGDDGGMPATQNSPCSQRAAAAGMRAQARRTQRLPCWETQPHLQIGLQGAKRNPSGGKGTHCFREMVADTVGPFNCLAFPVRLFPSAILKVSKVYGDLCYSASRPHCFPDPRTEQQESLEADSSPTALDKRRNRRHVETQKFPRLVCVSLSITGYQPW